MSEKYTREDVIIWPDDERLKDALIKECYPEDTPFEALERANNHSDDTKILVGIDFNNRWPFQIDKASNCACIILKKEPQKKYVPFDLSDEKVRDSLRGKWVTDGEGYETMITAIFRDRETDEMVANGRTAERLLKEYTFLDGSPCGVEVEE